MLFTLSFVLVLALARSGLAFALGFDLLAFAFARAGLAFALVVRAIRLCSCFASIRFSSDSLPPCNRKFHTMNS